MGEEVITTVGVFASLHYDLCFTSGTFDPYAGKITTSHAPGPPHFRRTGNEALYNINDCSHFVYISILPSLILCTSLTLPSKVVSFC